MLWWVARMPFLRHRGLVAWMALGLIGGSATFAVWTSGGGLETRQFTFFALVAVVALSVFGASRWGLLAASLSLAAAALTRPEGLLVAACCVGWFAAHRWFTARQLDWRGTLALAGPFVVLIGGHFLARYRYYGEWLPNTYYAKHVGPWYESGFRYLWAAAIETGLYLLIPAGVGGATRSLARAPGWDLCAGAAAGWNAHGLSLRDWRRLLRIPPDGPLLAIAGGAGG